MTDSLAMGYPLSPILSDIYMHYFETNMFQLVKFPFYVRYVDDCFVLLDLSQSDLDGILSIINSIDPCIQFTYEVEINNSLSFLDVKVTRDDNKFSTTVYRKPFSVSLPPHKDSCHPPSQRIAAFNTFVFRAINICSRPDLLQSELDYLRAVAIDRGFSPTIIDRCVRKFSKLKNSSFKPELNKSLVVLPF